MTSHLLKLIWNRKRSAKWIILEIALCFIAIFGAASTFLHFNHLYQKPLGFEYSSRWQVYINTGGSKDYIDEVRRLKSALVGFGPIKNAALLQIPCFENSSWTSNFFGAEGDYDAMRSFADDDLQSVLDIHLVEGRWFGPQDDGKDEFAVVIDKPMADTLFPDESALGKNIGGKNEDSKVYRVVGVMEMYRQRGELSHPMPYVMVRLAGDNNALHRVNNIILEMDGNETPTFENELVKKLEAMAPDWSFTIKNWEVQRKSHMKPILIPLTVLGIILGFMLLMVALGLLGVLWQNVLQRVQEIGLRQAMGASRMSVLKQISVEMFIQASLGMALGALVALQVPLLAPLPVEKSVWIAGFFTTVAIIFLIIGLSSLYPSFLASRIQPAHALKDE